MEEAEGYKRLLTLTEPTYTVEQIAAKVGKSPVYITTRLKLTDLCDEATAAFYKHQIGVGHALLLAKLPAEHQLAALKACFKEVYTGGDKPAHVLLPVRNLQFWIATNVLLLLKDTPFSKRDAGLVPPAGSCADCPKRTGHNKLLFGDDLGKEGDQCKLCGIRATASVFCWLAAAVLPACGVRALVPVLLGSPPGGSCAGRVYCSPYLLGSLSLGLIGRSCACVAYVAVTSWAILQHP
jgi:hypothetical protein